LDRDLSGQVLEVGAGTGIFTRVMAAALDPPSPILAIEPNAEMRAYAERVTPAERRVQYRDGTAERLELGDRSVKLLVAAAAAQRFNRPVFYREAARVLQPGGLLMLVHNNPRDADSPFFSAYLGLLEKYVPTYKRGRRTASNGSYEEVDFRGELSRLDEFSAVELMTWKLEEFVDQVKFTQLVLSSTILAPVLASAQRATVIDEAQHIFDRHVDRQGRAYMPYLTEAVFARRGGQALSTGVAAALRDPASH
jgi:ubiquinone/menaquinone biosynthesis C-methylase UbiE